MKLEKKYKPYEGESPYLYLAFSDSDSKRAEKLMSALYEKNVRFWYYRGKTEKISVLNARQQRMNDATAVVLFLTKNAASDISLKSDIIYLINSKIPIIVYECDKDIPNLSLGIPEVAPRVDTPEDLFRCEGFSYDLIAPTPLYKMPVPVFRIVAVVLALALIAGGYAYKEATRDKTPDEEKTRIYLEKVPENLSELDRYPKLETIVIPKTEAKNALCLLDDYTVVIVEGNDA